MRPGVVSIAIVAAGIANTTLTADTFTAAVATGWSDPVTGDPDFADLRSQRCPTCSHKDGLAGVNLDPYAVAGDADQGSTHSESDQD